jgi:hypothetical protein
MIDNILIGPATLDDRMTGHNCANFQQNGLPVLEAVPLNFQHDAAPSHTRLGMQQLNDIFPDRWIGRGSTINWPPRSPILTPSDFCLWGLSKE